MSPLPLQEFARCIINTDPAEYALPVPNIVHFLVAYEWQHLYIAKKAGLCDNMPTKGLKRIAVNSGMLQGRGRRRGARVGGRESLELLGFRRETCCMIFCTDWTFTSVRLLVSWDIAGLLRICNIIRYNIAAKLTKKFNTYRLIP